MRAAIINRISRRSYSGEPLNGSEIQKISEMLEQINEKSGLNFQFLEDGSHAFNNFRSSYGMFKNVRSIILLKGNEKTDYLKEKIGYFGEELVLDITDMELGTCWVGGTFDKNSISIPDDEVLYCVIVVGKVDNLSAKERIIRKAGHLKTKPMDERIIYTEPLPAWAEKGMQAVMLAPNAVNAQRVTFKYENGVITAEVPGDKPADMIDLGIAKKHFEIEAEGKFVFGNGAEFNKA